MPSSMICPKKWDEFQSTGLLWLVNTTLHVFGWAIVVVTDLDDKVVDCYPARVRFRGFSTEANAEGHTRVAEYLAKNAGDLREDLG